MQTQRRALLPIVVSASLAFLGSGAASQEAERTAEARTRLEFRISPAVDLHFYIRALAEDQSANVPEPLQAAVQAAQAVSREMGRGMWGAMESQLGGANTVADIRKAFADLPEEYTPRFGPRDKKIALRSLAGKLVEGIASGEAYFLEQVWPEHKRAVEQDLARLERDFVPNFDTLLTYMLEHLHMQDPKITVPVYLVAAAQFPGGFTMVQRGGAPIMFVQTTREHHRGTLLYELIIHESCHALDVSGESVFQELRDELSKAGLSPRDALFRDVPHTIMFAQAGETIRRKLDPNHKHYGEVATYYDRTGAAGEFVPRLWIEYLDGKLTREQALAAILKETLKIWESD